MSGAVHHAVAVDVVLERGGGHRGQAASGLDLNNVGGAHLVSLLTSPLRATILTVCVGGGAATVLAVTPLDGNGQAGLVRYTAERDGQQVPLT